MRTLVSLDIETTGLDPDRDAILEIGAVRFRGDAVLDEWSCLVDPRRDIPDKIVELTGITPEMVQREGIPLQEGLRQAQRIVGPSPIVGHSIAFDLGFLRRKNVFVANPAIDTFELAAILVPHAGRYTLAALAGELGIRLPATHRALDDARVAHQLYLKVFDRAVALPRDTLEEIVANAERSGWSQAGFWRDALETQARGVFTTAIGSQVKRARTGQNLIARRAALKAQLDAVPLQAADPVMPLDVDEVARTLAEDGPFARHFPGYEMRPQQVDMLRLVTQVFNDGGHALIEAGTGVGKSLAYLIPAMLWATRNGERVVVSTNTINLQEQLAEKDVPAVVGALGVQGRAAVLKGRGRYVCPLRLAEMRKNGPRSLDETRLLTKILIWLPNTLTGDGDELFMPTPGERAVFQQLSAQNPACNYSTCSANDCYFHQARRIAESAHVVIVNHALLLADIAVENRALPEYKYLVVDEAHHLEAAATDSLSFTVDRDALQRALDDLHASGGRRPSGLLADVATQAKLSLPVDQGAFLVQRTDAAAQVVARAGNLVDAFFDRLAQFLEDHASGDTTDYARRVRITHAVRHSSGWSLVEIDYDNLQRELNALARDLDGLTRALSELGDTPKAGLDVLAARALGALRYFSEAIENLNGLICKPNDQTIYWAEIEPSRRGDFSKKPGAYPPRLTLHAAPLHVGQLMKRHIWDAKKSVVLTSATLRAATPASRNLPSFEHLQERLSAEHAQTLAVGSPFDYKSSTLLYLVTDIPEPSQAGHQPFIERALVELFRASQGRGMALFTSYSQLRATARAIGPELQREGIVVYEQGDGSSRRVMLERFRASDKAVLLGTRSFWEGVDIQGDRLSVLAICKLPFDVPTDPVFAARSEMFQDPFNEYSVPETVLRFRQGFGQLIRAKTDRGVVVVLDKRLLTKGYGAAFLNILPSPTERRGPLSGLARAVADWLKPGRPRGEDSGT